MFFFLKWPPVAILDVQKSLLTISDQYHNFYCCECFLQNGCRLAFWMSETHFRSHFWPFQINTKLFYLKIFTKWPPVPILDVRNSLSIAFLDISDLYATCIFLDIFDIMPPVGHFRCPKFTFDHISDHFLDQYGFFFNFLTKWPAADILDV